MGIKMLHPDQCQQLLTRLRMGIQKRQYAAMCRLYRRWLYGAQSGDVESLISRCPGELRNNLLVLLRDLLMHFPQAVFGIPCLVQHSWSELIEGDLFIEDGISFPMTGNSVTEPLPGLHFIGWAKPSSAFTSTGRQPALDKVSVVPGKAVGVIAMFKAIDESLVYDENASLPDDEQWLHLPDFWWARLMGQMPGNLLLQTHRLMPYPEAVEAARIMCDAAGVERFSVDRPSFVRQLDIEQVKDKARHFKRLQTQA